MVVAPGGTGAVLVRPSRLSMDIAAEVVKVVPLDGVCRDIGSLAAGVVADELESRGLRPADYARLPELSRDVRRRIGKALKSSDVFDRAFMERLGGRG